MTKQEIEEFVLNELSDFNLSTKEKDRYVAFIKKLDDHYTAHHTPVRYAHNIFLQKLDECIEFFRIQGFDEETSTELAKKAVLEFDRKDFKTKLSLLRVLNFEESVIRSDSLSLRFNLEKTHAKKMHLVTIDNKVAQTRNTIIHEGESIFEKRFNVQTKDILKQYPLTSETKEVWMIITHMDDEKFQNYFGITSDELSYIYPSTKEELATIHFISTLSDEEIMQRYGITRQELLQKHPLNNDTLKALKSINSAKKETVEKLFKQPKEDVLKLRTITTEMIKLANKRKINLQQSPFPTKEDLDIHKQKEKGTYPNG